MKPRILIAVLACLFVGACKREERTLDERGARQTARLVGAWRESGGDREVVLAADGSFSMTMATACSDGAAKPGSSSTTSGHWLVRGGSLVLQNEKSSEPILLGATMTDEIIQLDDETLVLNSSVTSCHGQRIRLARQPSRR